MCEVLVGLGEVDLVGVEELSGDRLRVTIRSRGPRPVCGECGGRVWSKGDQPVRLVDLPAVGRPVRLRWHKRRWKCPEPTCGVNSFAEQDVSVAPQRALLTSRAGRWVTDQVGRSGRTVSEVAAELGCDWHTVNREVTRWGEAEGTYGSPRVWAELRHGLGVRVGRKRVERLMRLAGLAGISRRRSGYRRRRRAGGEVAADLVDRQFSPTEADRLWMADITEHPTREGIVYLAVVMDAWNREIIGWSIADHIRAEIVCDAFDMARWRRRPKPHSGLVHHSDHGAQYTSWRFGKTLHQSGVLKSMGSVGDAYDNAVVESFFATLQTELLDRHRWETRRQLSTAIFEYIEGWYNTERRHSHNNYQSPVNHRHQHQKLVA